MVPWIIMFIDIFIEVYLTYIHTFSEPLIYLSCFIFMFQLIEYQSFQKMKHTTFMFQSLNVLIINELKHKMKHESKKHYW